MVARAPRKVIRKPVRGGGRPRRRLGVTAAGVGNAARVAGGLAAAAGTVMQGRRNSMIPKAVPSMAIRMKRRAPPSRVEMDIKKHRIGRKKRPTLGLLRTLALNRIVLRYQGLNRLGGIAAPACPGFHPLEGRLVSATGTGGTSGAGSGASILPVHVFELASVNTSAAARPAGYGLRIADNGEIGFEPLPGQDTTGTSQPSQPYAFEFGDMSSVQAGVRFVNLLWSDIRILLHGCMAETAVVDIMVVRFDPRYAFLDPATSTAGLTTQDAQQRHSFWQTFSRSLVTSPAMHGNQESQKGMWVTRRARHVLQPSQTVDINDEPQTRLVRLFCRQNRVIDLKEQGTPLTGDTGLFSQGWRTEDLSSTQFSSIPRVGQRQYLIIRCLNTVQRDQVASRTHTPSYDISIRRKLEFTKIT